MKEWYAARRAEGESPKNINTMSVLYSIASLIDLDRKRGGGVFSEEEREWYERMLHEWAEWVMNELPSEQRSLRIVQR